MKKKLLSLTLCLFFFFAFGMAQDKDEEQIRLAMEKQSKAWNNGDIPTFMETYWKNDSLLFVGSRGPVYGWQQTLDNYLRSYPDVETMGTLRFDLLDLKPLSPGYYFVLGKWHLSRSKGDVGGAFTLLFRKIEGQWLIIADHSS